MPLNAPRPVARSLADPSPGVLLRLLRAQPLPADRAVASRWHIEECFQQAKGEARLDHHQVRTWRAWYAHTTLPMLALA